MSSLDCRIRRSDEAEQCEDGQHCSGPQRGGADGPGFSQCAILRAVELFDHGQTLVRTGEQFLLIPKIEVSLVDPYVDVRDWGLDDWEKHPQLLAAMKDHGHADLLPETRSGPRRGDSPGSFSDDSGDHLGTIPARLVPRELIPRSGARDDETARRE